MKKTANLRKIYNLLIKLVIIILAYYFIYNQIFRKEDIDKVLLRFKNLFFSEESFIVFIIVLFLMFINWGFETVKWRFLIKKIEKISFFKAYEAVLTGVTISTFLPNRTGEYLGRVFILDKANRVQGVLITIIGSLSQLIITIVAGLLAFIVFIFYYGNKYINIQNYLLIGITIFVLVILILVLYFYFNIASLNIFLNKIKLLRKYKIYKYLKVFSYYNYGELRKVLLWSFFRYIVFAIQFYMLIKVFGIEISLLKSVLIIALIFFLTTIIPTIVLTDLGIRGTVSISVYAACSSSFSLVNEQTNIALISAVTMLWLINIIIPALIGSLLIYNLRFFRKNQR